MSDLFRHDSRQTCLVAKALCIPVAVDHCVGDRFSFLPEPCGGSSSSQPQVACRRMAMTLFNAHRRSLSSVAVTAVHGLHYRTIQPLSFAQ